MKRMGWFFPVAGIWFAVSLGSNAYAQDPRLLPEGLINYVIRLNEVPEGCGEEALRSLSLEGEAFTTRYLGLRRTTCVFHRNSTSVAESNATEREEQLDLNAKAIGWLQQGQKAGLPPVHQTYATLLEALLHCRQAEHYRVAMDANAGPNGADGLSRDRFCLERRAAAANFSDIDWGMAYFEYRRDFVPPAGDAVSAPTLSQTQLGNFHESVLFDEMATCYASALDPVNDGMCGLFAGLTEKQQMAVVNAAVERVVHKYFEGAKSPVTAMFQRKRERVKKVSEEGAEKIQELAEQAETVVAKYNAYQDAFDTVAGEADVIVVNYRDAVSTAYAIHDAFDRWVGGLFYNDSGDDTKKWTKDAVELLQDLEAPVCDSSGSSASTFARAQSLVEEVENLERAHADRQGQVVKLCKIYFCQLMGRDLLGFEPSFSTTRRRVCASGGMTGNPMCVGATGELVASLEDGTEVRTTIGELCAGAGMPAQYMRVNMSADEAAECLSDM